MFIVLFIYIGAIWQEGQTVCWPEVSTASENAIHCNDDPLENCSNGNCALANVTLKPVAAALLVKTYGIKGSGYISINDVVTIQATGTFPQCKLILLSKAQQCNRLLPITSNCEVTTLTTNVITISYQQLSILDLTYEILNESECSDTCTAIEDESKILITILIGAIAVALSLVSVAGLVIATKRQGKCKFTSDDPVAAVRLSDLGRANAMNESVDLTMDGGNNANASEIVNEGNTSSTPSVPKKKLAKSNIATSDDKTGYVAMKPSPVPKKKSLVKKKLSGSTKRDNNYEAKPSNLLLNVKIEETSLYDTIPNQKPKVRFSDNGTYDSLRKPAHKGFDVHQESPYDVLQLQTSNDGKQTDPTDKTEVLNLYDSTKSIDVLKTIPAYKAENNILQPKANKGGSKKALPHLKIPNPETLTPPKRKTDLPTTPNNLHDSEDINDGSMNPNILYDTTAAFAPPMTPNILYDSVQSFPHLPMTPNVLYEAMAYKGDQQLEEAQVPPLDLPSDNNQARRMEERRQTIAAYEECKPMGSENSEI